MAFIEGPRSAEISRSQQASPEAGKIGRDQPRSAGRELGRGMTFIEGPAGGSRGEIMSFIDGIAMVRLCQGTEARLTRCHVPATAKARPQRALRTPKSSTHRATTSDHRQ